MNQPPICPKADNVVRTLSQTPPPTYPKLFWLFLCLRGPTRGKQGRDEATPHTSTGASGQKNIKIARERQ